MIADCPRGPPCSEITQWPYLSDPGGNWFAVRAAKIDCRSDVDPVQPIFANIEREPSVLCRFECQDRLHRADGFTKLRDDHLHHAIARSKERALLEPTLEHIRGDRK